MRPGRSCVCRFTAGQARVSGPEFFRAIRESKLQRTDREKGGPGAVRRKPANGMAVEKAGSAETGVRGARYQYTRLIYVGFVGEGIRSNTFTDGYFQVLQFSVTIRSLGVFWEPPGDGKAVQNAGWACQRSIELIENNKFDRNS